MRLAVNHWANLLAIVISSFFVAFFWGANISALYPFVEVIFQGDSMHSWVERKIDDATRQASDIRLKIDQIEQQTATATAAERNDAERALTGLKRRLSAEQAAVARTRWLEPHIKRHLPQDPFLTLVAVVGFVLISTLVKTMFLGMNLVLVERLAERTKMELRNVFYRGTLDLDILTFTKDGTGDLTSRFTGDIDAVGTGVTTLFGKSLREPLKMIVCIFVAACVSWQLLLFSLIVAPLPLFLLSRLASSIKRSSRRAMEEMAKLFDRLSETLTGITVVKAFTMESIECQRFSILTRQLMQKSMRISVYTSLTRMNNELLGVGVVCLAILLGGYLVLHKATFFFGIQMANRSLEYGELMLVFGCLVGMADPARKMTDVFASLQRAAAGADRVYHMIDRRPTIQDPVSPRSINKQPGGLQLENVHFHYKAGTPILQEVNLQIGPRETIAIVGPNGCGKSTLLNLIPRFYDPVQGVVRYQNIDVRNLRLNDLRKKIGVVSQHSLLFEDTVLNNIRYGSPSAADGEVTEAAKKAHADQFIVRNLEHGYLTDVGQGGNRLSGGQRQRIALARAILRDPDILLLDEATSQIDPESERLIHRALEQFIRGRIAILVTHRLSTLTLANRIVVMKEGKIADIGSHHELMERCDLYARLHHNEFKKSA